MDGAESWVVGCRTAIDLSRQLDLSKPKITFTSSSLLPTLTEAYTLLSLPPSPTEVRVRTVLVNPRTSLTECEDVFKTLDELREPISIDEVQEEDARIERKGAEEADETSVLCFSSGTEGLSKGVE